MNTHKVGFLSGIFMFALVWINISADTIQIPKAQDTVPLAFTENAGQNDAPVLFTSYGSGCSIFFTPAGTTFLLRSESENSVEKTSDQSGFAAEKKVTQTALSEKDHECFALKLNFSGSNPNTAVSGENRLPWNSNYFIGDDSSQWKTDVANYEKIRLSSVYDGIDLVYYGTKLRLKYDFVIQPGNDPSQIVLQYDFGDSHNGSLSVNTNGELVVSTPVGDIIERKPYCYQMIDGVKKEVQVSYKIIDSESHRYSFDIGEYNEDYPLVIDPELVFSTFLGGSDDDLPYCIAVNSAGDVFVAGETVSTDFPLTDGAYDTVMNESSECFVTKLNASGSYLDYSTLLGITGVTAMALGPNGSVYLTGTIWSSSFPATAGAYDVSYNDRSDAFIIKLSASGGTLDYATLIGGNNTDDGYVIEVDNTGNAYIIGKTFSNQFPTTPGTLGTSRSSGTEELFITKLSLAGNSLIYSTLLGVSDVADVYGMALDAAGCVYFTGWAYGESYPTTSVAYSTEYSGNFDVYLTKLNSTGTALVFSTFFGTTGIDVGSDILVDGSGFVYVTGYTNSVDFPKTADAYDVGYNGENDIFVSKFNAAGNILLNSTFIGTMADDEGKKIEIDSEGNIYVIGQTVSSDFVTTPNALNDMYRFGPEGVILKFNNSLSSLEYSSYLSGVADIAIDSKDMIYVTGRIRHISDYSHNIRRL